ncbi:hypothetical protein B0T22DRAFT_533005 [Podospora appendiculata]|uniref:Uncharacterized protein n=1 Tax=Podospora appendiculata TaxID=314037 RepID=A0AAE0XHZ8_9PEZI|nr:hypothetical protein B0T22DRAFT_533005 [Podospora appendiculata]
MAKSPFFNPITTEQPGRLVWKATGFRSCFLLLGLISAKNENPLHACTLSYPIGFGSPGPKGEVKAVPTDRLTRSMPPCKIRPPIVIWRKLLGSYVYHASGSSWSEPAIHFPRRFRAPCRWAFWKVSGIIKLRLIERLWTGQDSLVSSRQTIGCRQGFVALEMTAELESRVVPILILARYITLHIATCLEKIVRKNDIFLRKGLAIKLAARSVC